MNITLPPDAQAIIDREIEAGHYATEADVIVTALKYLDIEHPGYDPMHDPKIVEAIAQSERGDVHEWNDALRAQIRREAKEDTRLGKPIPDDIKY